MTENLFISTQQNAAEQPQLLAENNPQLQFNVQDTFKCPIYLAKKPEWVDTLNKSTDPIIERVRKTWKKKIKDKKDPAKTMPNSLHSESIWNYPEFKDITMLILQQSWNILSWQGYNLDNRIPLLTELWVQEFPEEGGFHDIHEHGNNHISGFYFLKCNEKTSHPVFWDPRPGKKMTDFIMKNQSKVNYGSQSIHYKVKPGDFIFFNSYMPHSYVHHKGKEKFRFIHFNMQAVIDPAKAVKST